MKRYLTIAVLAAAGALAAGCPSKTVRTATVITNTETVTESRIIDPAVPPERALVPEEPERTTETTTVREHVIESGTAVQ